MSRSGIPSEYVGRFAPSPTGLLHLGSMLTAYASYCDAMKNNGKWLLRIEDLDPQREIKGASRTIISTLENYGFEFNKNIVFQSQYIRQKAYLETLNKLESLGVTYKCSCSRSDLKKLQLQDHICRFKAQNPTENYSIKARVSDKPVTFEDRIQGLIQYNNPENNPGDFVIKRKEGYFSYQIAVIADDFFQNVTHIVRGTDLIHSTPWQIFLIQLLHFNPIQYAHVPVIINSQGQKLSKQTYAREITHDNPIEVLLTVHRILNQEPFIKKPKSLEQFWLHAIENWNLNKIPKTNSVEV